MQKPTPRPEVYESYWKFAAERQHVFESRVMGKPWPWTQNRILRQYKFCNVYRAADRVSQYLIRNIIYSDENVEEDDLLFQIVAFRFFSNIATWESVRDILGHSPRLCDLESGAFEKALALTQQHNKNLYTGAFILCATNAYGRPLKYQNHIELFRDMFLKSNLASRILLAKSLKGLYETLHAFPLMGDFMSYQIAIDLNYSPLVNFSENDFTQPGPGAIRGIKKVFLDLGDLTPQEAIMWMVEHQQDEFDRLGLEFHGLWGRPIQAIDAQNLFCETDKYCRAAFPELRSCRSRIKTRYTPTSKPLALFFPPKWGINEKMGEATVRGESPISQGILEFEP